MSALEGQGVAGTPGNGCEGLTENLSPLPANGRDSDGEQIDWELSPELVAEVNKRAAMVARRWRRIIPLEDLRTEGLIWCATHPATIAKHLANPAQGTAYTGWHVQSHLSYLCSREHDKHGRDTSYEAARAWGVTGDM